MTDLAENTKLARHRGGSEIVAVVATYCILALALCLVVALYSDAANIAPPDPAASALYP